MAPLEPWIFQTGDKPLPAVTLNEVYASNAGPRVVLLWYPGLILSEDKQSAPHEKYWWLYHACYSGTGSNRHTRNPETVERASRGTPRLASCALHRAAARGERGVCIHLLSHGSTACVLWPSGQPCATGVYREAGGHAQDNGRRRTHRRRHGDRSTRVGINAGTAVFLTRSLPAHVPARRAHAT